MEPSMTVSSDLPTRAAAEFQKDRGPGFFRTTLGDFEVTALYDGGNTNFLKPELFRADTNEVVALLQNSYDPDTIVGSIAGFLVNTGEKLVLVDAGTGDYTTFGTSLGKLLANFVASGYRPDQVDLVLITHLHPDHVGGITSLAEKCVFPNAEIIVPKLEADYWLSEDAEKKSLERDREFFGVARKVAAPYIAAGKWRTFNGAVELLADVRAYPIHGHTPGHTGYEFTSKGQTMLVWGDIVNVADIQFQRPEIGIIFDMDGPEADKTRQDLLERVATKRIVVAGTHLPFPGIGRLRKDGFGYAWMPVSYLGTP
jgi:glyoxylase-like metal-dependent hydrolase (beta-lactamase superfamily II)